MDGQWYCINNMINIPEDIQENFNKTAYVYDESAHVLDPDSTLIMN